MKLAKSWLAFVTTGGSPWRLSNTLTGQPVGLGVKQGGNRHLSFIAYSLPVSVHFAKLSGKEESVLNRKVPRRKISAFGKELPKKMLGYTLIT